MGHSHTVLSWFDTGLARLMIFAIRIYQFTWSGVHGRTCLFCPSCSWRAIQHFRTAGFREGIRLTRAQLVECCGDYSMRFDEAGRIELITKSGVVVREGDINPVIAERLTFARDFASLGAVD
jgi:putative component of membrane protein insertase Oxa1/YidC/SpoIIIJ protein YidD